MRMTLIPMIAAAGLALAACSQADQAKTEAAADDATAEVREAANKVAAETKEAAADVKAGTQELADSPTVQNATAEVKDAVSDVGKAAKTATGNALERAGQKMKEGAGEANQAAEDAKR